MVMVNRFIAASILSFALIALGIPAYAQSKPCKADIEKFCAKVEKGEGRILKCLEEHSKELSAECKKAIETHPKARQAKRTPRAKQQATRRAEQAACNGEVEKYCKATKGKPDELTACLREHTKDFSPACREKIEALLKRIEEQKAKKK
jgi:hypothetical protein